MLHRLSANKDEFESIEFKPGFNVIMADRDPGATDQQSRNARGKTSLLYVLNFLLGGNLAPNLKSLVDNDWEFTLGVDLFGHEVAATRRLASPSRVALAYPDELSGALAPYLDGGSVSLEDWKDLLGLALFKLEPTPEGDRRGISPRTLLSYVVRSAASPDPLKIMPNQPAVSSRMHIAFLLGLDWQLVRELRDVNRELDDLGAIARATSEHVLQTLRPADELVLERATAQNNLDEALERVSQFRVLEDPSGLVVRADQLTELISGIRDSAFVERRMVTLYENSLADESTASSVGDETDVLRLYESVGMVFAEGSRRRLEDVKAFRQALLVNRRAFLESELNSARSRIADYDHELEELDRQREPLLATLRAGGALEELVQLQLEVGRLNARVEVFDSQIEQARDVDSTRDELRLAKAQFRREANQKLAEQRAKLDEVNDRFRAKMKRLYNSDAALTVDVDDDGYKFAVRVSGGSSSAINKMTLFCFDLTLLEEGAATGHHPDFLVHDSTVFDGVDPRQRASALQFAHDSTEALGGQYVCTINSNDVPEDVAASEWFTEGVVRTVLDTDEGGAFGVAF